MGSATLCSLLYTVHMDMNEATSKALAAERSAAHLTIKELAEKSGVPERTLIRLLKNERNINVIQIAQIASAVGVYPHEIIESAERFLERADRGPVTLETPHVSDIPPTDATPALADADAGAGDAARVARRRELAETAARESRLEEETLRQLAVDPLSLAAYHDPRKHDPQPDNAA